MQFAARSEIGAHGSVADGPRALAGALAKPLLLALFLLASARGAHAEPELAALAPPAGDDARTAIALGPSGQMFAPDGKGGWIRDQRVSIADRITAAGRAGAQTVVLGDGVIYRFAPNGWTAIRIMQKGKATMSPGHRAIAAVGRQLYAIDRPPAGESVKLALAPSPVLAIGTGKGIVIALDRGLFRVDGARLTALKRVPRRVDQLVTDRWALVERAALDLRSGKSTPWPEGVKIVAAAGGPSESLVAVSENQGALELVTFAGPKVVRDPLPASITSAGSPVGVALDSSGRAVIALRDGRICVRERGAWTVTTVREALPPPQPGAPPATSP